LVQNVDKDSYEKDNKGLDHFSVLETDLICPPKKLRDDFWLLSFHQEGENIGDIDENNHITSLGNGDRRFLCLGKRD
jgi:hypothetical protein